MVSAECFHWLNFFILFKKYMYNYVIFIYVYTLCMYLCVYIYQSNKCDEFNVAEIQNNHMTEVV